MIYYIYYFNNINDSKVVLTRVEMFNSLKWKSIKKCHSFFVFDEVFRSI